MKKDRRASEDKVAPAAADVDEEDDFLGADDGDDNAELKVSEKFARKYNDKKDKELLAKNKRLLEDEASDSSSASESDDAAELLTPAVESKIFQTLQKIKSRDPSIYDDKHVFFGDDDFSERKMATPSSGSSAGASKKGTKYKDFLRETLLRDGADALVREEEALERKGKRKTPAEEQMDLKKDIMAAAFGDEGEEDEDDFFVLKEKSTEEKRKEDEEFEEFLKTKPGRSDADGEEIISRYWKADEDLDNNEQFLRDFILNKGWMETGSLQGGTATGSSARGRGFNDGGELDSSEEEDHLDKADEFEKEYNFRFEAEDGGQIQGHARVQESSVREKNDKRKRQRREKEERKETEKIRRTEELKRLKNLKKQEIVKRLKQLQEVTGNEDTAIGKVDLDADFDPDAHDQEMGKLLGDTYDEQEEDLPEEELTQAPVGLVDLDVSTAGSTVPAMDAKRARKNSGLRHDPEEGGKNDEEEAGAAVEEEVGEDGEEDEDVDDQTWWLCDMCQKGIPAGKRRFDCSVCENYTLCTKCFRVRKHPHKFVRKRVPEAAMPPPAEEVKSLVPEAGEGMKDVLDEYFQLDYEDIIGGDLPTRFKYRSVESNSYGLTPQELLTKSDQELNRVVPLKKLRTYRGEGGDHGDLSRGRGTGRGGGKGKGKGAGRASFNKGASSSAKAEGGVSSQRLQAYNLQGDRGRVKKKFGKKDKSL